MSYVAPKNNMIFTVGHGPENDFVCTGGAIVSVHCVGTTAIFTTLTPHGLSSGDLVYVRGVSVNGYNTLTGWIVLASGLTSNIFQVTLPGTLVNANGGYCSKGNDDVQIQSAINACIGNGGGTWYLRAGDYVGSNQIIIWAPGIRSLGDGPIACYHLLDNGTNDGFHCALGTPSSTDPTAVPRSITYIDPTTEPGRRPAMSRLPPCLTRFGANCP